MTGVVTRFAPSPTGRLHLGHAFSALYAERASRSRGGRFLLRIEDIDPTRCRPEHEAAILEDLAWLGVRWDGEVRRQSEHLQDYRDALARLGDLVYPCFCTRRDIAEEIARAGSAPHGPDGPVYPGICRDLNPSLRRERIAAGSPYALRLDIARAVSRVGDLSWHDASADTQRATPELLGDIVLARKETPTSYHLAVTLDDHLQGVTLVTRGADLFPATHVHRLLQALLGLMVPNWDHHPLIRDAEGLRLAKRTNAPTLATLRKDGITSAEIRTRLGF
jgi:glutamyl-Q tRNA(Asp) synthetase